MDQEALNHVVEQLLEAQNANAHLLTENKALKAALGGKGAAAVHGSGAALSFSDAEFMQEEEELLTGTLEELERVIDAKEREHSSRRQAQVALVEVNAVTPIVRACEAAATTAAAQAELHQGTASSSEEALFGLKQALNDAQEENARLREKLRKFMEGSSSGFFDPRAGSSSPADKALRSEVRRLREEKSELQQRLQILQSGQAKLRVEAHEAGLLKKELERLQDNLQRQRGEKRRLEEEIASLRNQLQLIANSPSKGKSFY